jgi:hypothetical protein
MIYKIIRDILLYTYDTKYKLNIMRVRKRENEKATTIKRDWMRTLPDTPDNPLTRDRILEWMASTGYVEGFINKKTHPLDKPFLEDYIQEVWVQIALVDPEKIVRLYRDGKGRFTNYIKGLIMNNIRSTCSYVYKNTRSFYANEVYLDDEQWTELTEDDTTDIEQCTMILDRKGDDITSNIEKFNITAELNLTELPKDE